MQHALADTFEVLRDAGADAFYQGSLAERSVEYLQSHGSSLTVQDFAEFQPETVEPISVEFRGLTVLTSPPNTHGFLLLRALRAVDELGITDPLGDGLGALLRVFHRGNDAYARRIWPIRGTSASTSPRLSTMASTRWPNSARRSPARPWCRTATPSASPPPTVTATRCR